VIWRLPEFIDEPAKSGFFLVRLRLFLGRFHPIFSRTSAILPRIRVPFCGIFLRFWINAFGIVPVQHGRTPISCSALWLCRLVIKKISI
jgi:hypothetical protein